MEQNKEPENRSTQIGLVDFWQMCKSNSPEQTVLEEWRTFTGKTNPDLNLTSYKKSNRSQTSTENKQKKPVKLSENNIVENLQNLGIGNDS